MVILMIRLLLTALFILYSVLAQDHLRKISGDAAPEKAQEPIDEFDDFIPTIDSSVQFDPIPVPPALPIDLQTVPKTSEEPQSPASLPVAPPSAQVAPPSIRPPDVTPTSPAPPAPPSSTSGSVSVENKTTSNPYDETQITVNIDDILPEPADDLEEFQKADLLKKEENDEVKELVKKTSVNMTNDYYITSPATTVTSELQEDAIGEEDVFDFDKLFDKKISIKNSGTTERTLFTKQSTTERRTTTTTSTTTTPKSTTTTSAPTTAPLVTTGAHKKTCIHVKDLQMVDDSVVVQAGMKKGTIEVSIELGEEKEDDEENNDDSSEEEEEEEEKETAVRQVRENKKPVVWKKFEMNCDEEEDDKGKICKLWAAGGLCGTHKPTMFLFCRKTCLCVGPY